MIKVGDRFETIRGEEYVVVKYENSQKVTVEFCDNYRYQLTTDAEYIRKGQIKNPYAPRIFEIGYFGVGDFKAKIGNPAIGYSRTPEYAAWMNMMSRCYDKNYMNPHLYEGVKVDDDWHCFQTFAEWYYDKVKIAAWDGRKCLDKDILGNGVLYSESTCSIVPPIINSAIATNHGGVCLPGVNRSTNGLYRVIQGYKSSTRRFGKEIDAHMSFVQDKSEKIKFLAQQFKENLDPIVFETLMTKDFRFKFSPFFSC